MIVVAVAAVEMAGAAMAGAAMAGAAVADDVDDPQLAVAALDGVLHVPLHILETPCAAEHGAMAAMLMQWCWLCTLALAQNDVATALSRVPPSLQVRRGRRATGG